MLKKDVVTRELYDILEKLRYPEVAQIRFEEFENTILVGKKRLDLLNWVLQESPGFNSTSLNKLKESTVDGITKFIIYYYAITHTINNCNFFNIPNFFFF